MAGHRRYLASGPAAAVAVTTFLALLAVMSMPAYPSLALAPVKGARSTDTLGGLPSPRTGSSADGHSTRLSGRHHSVVDESVSTPLAVTIDELPSIAITRGEPLEVSGQVSNPDDKRWGDAQVYLTMTAEPATSKIGLDQFSLVDGGFGTPVEVIGLFDEIGPLTPGEKKSYSLSVPFRYLPMNRTPGVYHVGVIVLATSREGRDDEADARADIVMPMLPAGVGESTATTAAPDPEKTTGTTQASSTSSTAATAATAETADRLKPTQLLSLVPLSAPVRRHSDGAFVDDSLGTLLSEGGRLRKVLDFALAAPAQTLELVVDPAILQACRDMAAGYLIRPGNSVDAGSIEGDAATQRAAAAWIADLEGLSESQGLTLLPWGSPASSALATSDLSAVIEAAVLAAKTYAAEANLSAAITDWPSKGLASRRGLTVTRARGATVQIVSQLSLPELRGDGLAPDEYPPAQVTLGTSDGPLTALVTRHDIGGVAFTSDVDTLELRQALAAEATVRSLGSPSPQTSVLAAPLYWDPDATAAADFRSLYDFATVSPTTLAAAETFTTAEYAGPVRLPRTAPPDLPIEMADAIGDLRNVGQVFVELLANQRRLSLEFYRELASAGSYWGLRQPNRATSQIKSSKRQKAAQISKVTITGLSFVTLSSESGRFPLTVTNGLDIPVTVRIDVVPRDAALQIEPLDPIEIGPGRTRDVEVVSRAAGSGLTAVRARLSTAGERPFGRPVVFDVRATQIGLAIWVVFGLAGAVIVVASGLRIYRRARTTGFRPRGELPP